MALNYRVLTQEDMDRMSVIPVGEYKFTVTSISLEKSKGGVDKHGQPKKIYDMLVANLRIDNEAGFSRPVKDWILLVESEEPMGFKLRHFANTCGLLEKYEGQTLEARDFMNKSGTLRIGIREYIDNQGEVRKQNTVLGYVKRKDGEAAVQNDNDFFNDDITF